ncbi:hypothetical protein TNCV_3709121 [Trichonephila clavipes]|nr:hypothetical protein TNCV_3709121 [Trichonephila clavipes]
MPAMIRYLDHWTTAEPEIVVRDQFIYMDDSTLPHKVTVVEDLLKEAGQANTLATPNEQSLHYPGSHRRCQLYGNVRYRPLKTKSRANCCSVQFTMGSGISSRYGHPSQNPV